MLETPALSMLRHARILRERELSDAVEARNVAAWPWLEAGERSRWNASLQDALARVAPAAPSEEEQFADPRLREHVRRVRERAAAESRKVRPDGHE